MHRLKVYIDTSVLGGVFDDEFREPTGAFFEQSRNGKFPAEVIEYAEDI